jgi:hypothetical protein
MNDPAPSRFWTLGDECADLDAIEAISKSHGSGAPRFVYFRGRACTGYSALAGQSLFDAWKAYRGVP